jgi:uncharacterized BrkB/YihY/UPF0761 family membrane protein
MKVPAPFARPVAIGQLLVGEVAAFTYVAIILDDRSIWGYVFLAAIHAPWAMFSAQCYWWAPEGRQFPVWVGRAAVFTAICGWLIGGWLLSR